MELCHYCDEEFDVDDWIDDGEPTCEECGAEFCSFRCRDLHAEYCGVVVIV